MLKFLIEFCPLVCFFITYKLYDILAATVVLLCTTTVGAVIYYWRYRTISIAMVLSSVLVLLTGGITIISGDTKYIKMKPTIAYLVFATLLMFGVMRNRGYIQKVFVGIEMEDTSWLVLSKRFMYYFFVMAMVNECVWRNFAEDVWVKFKVFGFLPLTLIFTASQVPFIYKNQKHG